MNALGIVPMDPKVILVIVFKLELKINIILCVRK